MRLSLLVLLFVFEFLISCGNSDSGDNTEKPTVQFTRSDSTFIANTKDNKYSLIFSKNSNFSLDDSFAPSEYIQNMHSFKFCAESKIQQPKCSVVTTSCCNQENSYDIALTSDPTDQLCFLVENFAEKVNVKKLKLKFELDKSYLAFDAK